MALPDLSGTTVGRYRVVRRIGAGAASAVYRAVDLADERQVALKFLDPELASRPGFLARCVEEIATVSRLEHPAIVPVHEVATRGPLTYVSMRLVRGGTLRDVLGRRPVDVRSALGIVREVASALHSAHESGVVHQDLKPSNVLVETDGSVLVADFGLAPARYGYPTSAPWYRSPEQVSGAEPDRRTDVHALGQLLYELVTGTRPPAEGHAGGAALPGQVDRVLFQALDPDPARRPATVVQFLGELGDVPAAGVRGAWARDQLPAHDGPKHRGYKRIRDHIWQSAACVARIERSEIRDRSRREAPAKYLISLRATCYHDSINFTASTTCFVKQRETGRSGRRAVPRRNIRCRCLQHSLKEYAHAKKSRSAVAARCASSHCARVARGGDPRHRRATAQPDFPGRPPAAGLVAVRA